MKIPEELEKVIKEIVAYEEILKKDQENSETDLEYLYDYADDYSQYPEHCNYNINDNVNSVVIKIDL